MGMLYAIPLVLAIVGIFGGLLMSSWSPISLLQSEEQTITASMQNAISVQDYDQLKNCAADQSSKVTYQQYLTDFRCGHVSINATTGEVLREFTIIAEENQPIVVSNEGHTADGWTFNGTIPGPTIRVTEGDHVRITFINSPESTRSHSIHMHSIHAGDMDGVSNFTAPGGEFVYDFVAQPAGVYPYHCHVDPLAEHINHGLYGVLIIDPKTPRPQMTEMVMLMNGYELNYEIPALAVIPPLEEIPGQEGFVESEEAGEGVDAAEGTEELGTEEEEAEHENEIYTVNGYAFGYMHTPIQVETNKQYRIYLVNMLEFDLINSFHVHGTLFEYQPSGIPQGTFVNDIVTLSQGDRGVLEINFPLEGSFMFHAHQTEFTDKGWMGFFEVSAGQQTGNTPGQLSYALPTLEHEHSTNSTAS